MAQLGARLDGIEEVVGSNPIGSTNKPVTFRFSALISNRRGSPQVGQKSQLQSC